MNRPTPRTVAPRRSSSEQDSHTVAVFPSESIALARPRQELEPRDMSETSSKLQDETAEEFNASVDETSLAAQIEEQAQLRAPISAAIQTDEPIAPDTLNRSTRPTTRQTANKPAVAIAMFVQRSWARSTTWEQRIAVMSPKATAGMAGLEGIGGSLNTDVLFHLSELLLADP